MMERDPDIAERYKGGKARAIAHLARGLLQKPRSGHTVSSIFYLKTQAGSAAAVEGLGLDATKLFAAAGAWLGYQALPAVLLLSALGGLAYALLARRLRFNRSTPDIALGPWISIATWLVWANLWAAQGL